METNLYYETLENGSKSYEELLEEKMKTNVALRILLELPLTPDMRKWYDAHFSEMLYDMTHKLAKVFYRMGGTPETLEHLREINKRD